MKIFDKIKYKLKFLFFSRLIKFSLKINSPGLTAVFFAKLAGRINNSGEYTVLCHGRSIFLDDVKAMARYSGRLRYLVIHRDYYKIILNHFCFGPERHLLGEKNYHTDDLFAAGKKQYHDYLARMFPGLKKRLGFQALLSGNLGYVEQQELARVCQEQQTPFVVLHKEGLAVPGAYDDWAEGQKNYRFIGAKLLVYSEKIKQAFLKAGIDGLTADRMVVVGIPRLDHCFRLAPGGQTVKQVVFFSFTPEKFNWLISDQAKLQQAKDRTVEFHKMVIDFAHRHPGIKVKIKTKFDAVYYNFVHKIYQDNFPGGLTNLEIINSGDPYSLIANSQAVIGFYSTTLIEATIAKRVIVCPYFGDLVTDTPSDYFVNYPELINYVRTGDELDGCILNVDSAGQTGSEQRQRFLSELIHIPDGRASQRAETAVINTINEYQSE